MTPGMHPFWCTQWKLSAAAKQLLIQGAMLCVKYCRLAGSRALVLHICSWQLMLSWNLASLITPVGLVRGDTLHCCKL